MKLPKNLIIGLLVLTLSGLLTACGDAQPTPLPTVASVSNLPLPNGVTRLDFSVTDLQKINAVSTTTNLTGVQVGAYATSQTSSEVVSFYQTWLTMQGWTKDTSRGQANLLYFAKGNLVSSIIALTVPSQSAADTLSNVVPAFRGKFKPGDTLLILAQGPTAAFTPA